MARILVVADDCLVRSAIRTWIETAGYEVVIADGAASGLRALDDTAVNLMIVDISMPRMRGLESVRLFHQRAPRVPHYCDLRLRVCRATNAGTGFPANGS